MTPRETRKQRREAERRARKIAAKSAANNNPIPASPSPVPTPDSSTPDTNSSAAAYIAELRAQADRELDAEFGAEFMAYSREVSDRMARRFGLPVSNHSHPEPNQRTPSEGQHAPGKPATAKDEAPQLSTPKPINKVAAPLIAAKLQTTAPAPHPTPKSPGHSTGPRTAAGKLASSRNSLKHGLASGALTIPGEDTAAFEALRDALLHQHQPANPTEHLLVHELAQSYWLQQRAIRFQNECFTAPGSDNKIGVDEKRLALFLRYGTTHERAFHKALNTLFRLQKERRKTQPTPAPKIVSPTIVSKGFVSQNDPPPSPQSSSWDFVSQKPGSPASSITEFSSTGPQNSAGTGRKLPDAA